MTRKKNVVRRVSLPLYFSVRKVRLKRKCCTREKSEHQTNSFRSPFLLTMAVTWLSILLLMLLLPRPDDHSPPKRASYLFFQRKNIPRVFFPPSTPPPPPPCVPGSISTYTLFNSQIPHPVPTNPWATVIFFCSLLPECMPVL